MKPEKYPWDFPDTVVVLGTDASGKDHVANVLSKMIKDAGGDVEKRQRFLSGKPTEAVTSEGKSLLENLQEKLFLQLYPKVSFLMPFMASVAIYWDLRKYSSPGEKKLIVVGNNPLRAMAFHLAGEFDNPEQIRLPWYFRRALGKLKASTGTHWIVLDIEDHVRRKRINKRVLDGSEDMFDLYMQDDSERSERIEACLEHLARNYLGAELIKNNDLSEEVLQEQLRRGFPVMDHHEY